MKVFVAFVLVIGSVAARGSGPYLPSGWKPDGPAFNLPSEVARPVPRIVQESVVEETEASGSDALREYGTPKLEVFLDVNQGLPDVASEQTFLRTVNDQAVGAIDEAINVDAKTEDVASVLEVGSTVTESQTGEAVKLIVDDVTDTDVQTSAESLSSDIFVQKEESSDIVQSKEFNVQEGNVPALAISKDLVNPTVLVEDAVVPLSQQELAQDAVPTLLSQIVSVEKLAGQELVPEAIPTSVSDVVASVTLLEQELASDTAPTPTEDAIVEKVVEGVNNIAETIINLENEVKAIEVQVQENAAEITSTQVTSALLEQAPEGFLEYAPPGFLEYGPPKQEVLERLAAEAARASALENNEVRRRRFSPKFSSKKKH